MGCVVARQVCIGIRVAQIINGHDLDIVFLAALIVGAQHVAANSAIPINCNSNRHATFSLIKNVYWSSTALAVAARLSAVIPKNLKSSPAGADSP